MKKLRFISFAIVAIALIVVSCQGPANPTKEPGNVQKAEEKKPVAPGTEKPVAPGTEKPVAPGTEKPVAPGTEKPVAPGTEKPVAPGTEKPVAPGTEKPVAPGTEKPVAPGTEKPVAPGTEKPEVKDPKAEKLLDGFIDELYKLVKEFSEEGEELTAEDVKEAVEAANVDFEQLNVKLVDKEANQPIKKDTDKEALKKRFVLEKL
uniref:PrrA n=1 Tax=Treponema phagedenis TaxID=162 RepID=A0A191VM86_TREPH|nr:PrrA [Treponema phagedenis]